MALLGLTLVQDEPARGVLAVPFGPSLPGLRYHLLRSRATQGNATLDRVAAWLQARPRLVAGLTFVVTGLSVAAIKQR